MIRILVIALIALFIYAVYSDMGESEIKQRNLRSESLKNKPDPNRMVSHWDWEAGVWVYEDSNRKLTYDDPPPFKPSFDSSLVEERDHYEVYIDPDLRPYVQLFIEYSKKFERPLRMDHKNVYIYFHSQISHTDNAAGQCLNTYDRFEVRIDPEDWVKYPKYREALVFHELGHCILGRSHLDEVMDNGMPISIMHSKWYAYRLLYRAYKTEYLQELFN